MEALRIAPPRFLLVVKIFSRVLRRGMTHLYLLNRW